MTPTFLRVRLLVGAFVLIALPAPRAQEVLTLEKALGLSAQRSMAADVGRLDTLTARLKTDQVEANWYPSFDLQAAHVNLDNAPFFVADSVVFPSGEKVFWEYKLSAREVLWDGGRRSWAMKASRSREAAVSLAGGDAVRRTQAEVVGRYVALLTLKEQQEVAAMRKRALEDHLRVVQDLFQQGVVARNDLLRTEVTLRSVEDQASSLESSWTTALEALNKAIGLDPRTPCALPGKLPPQPPLPWDDETCRSRALENNEGLRALAAKVKGLEETVTLAQRDFYPTLIAEASASYTQNRYLLYPYVNSLFVGVAFNFYDGGAKSAKVRQARADVDRARRELLEARRGVEVAAGQQLRDFQEALRETGTARANVGASLENLRIIEDQYKEGLARTIDVLDAESVLAESRFAEAQTYYQAYAKQAALLAAMGEDLERFYGGLQDSSPKEDNHGIR